MGSKRPISDVDGSATQDGDVNKKRKQQFNKTHYRNNDNAPEKEGHSLNEIKKRARNIERRFAKGDTLPADVQQRLERELVQCKRQIDDLQHKKKRHEMISKYHRVRFFERQKAERLRKQLKKQLDAAADDTEDKARLETDFHIADVDWHYTRFFPFLERYEGLYAAEKSKEDAEGQTIAMRALHSPRPPMWKVVEAALAEGPAALAALQERRSAGPGAGEAKKERKEKKAPQAKEKKVPEPEVVQSRPEAVLSKPEGSRRERRRIERERKMGMTETVTKTKVSRDDAAADGDADGTGFFG